MTKTVLQVSKETCTKMFIEELFGIVKMETQIFLSGDGREMDKLRGIHIT